MLAFVAFVVGVLVVGGLLFLGASLLLGRGETQPPAELDRSPVELPDDRPVTADDIRALRISVAFRGYRMTEVDWLLDQFALVLDERDAEIAALRPAPLHPPARPPGEDDERRPERARRPTPQPARRGGATACLSWSSGSTSTRRRSGCGRCSPTGSRRASGCSPPTSATVDGPAQRLHGRLAARTGLPLPGGRHVGVLDTMIITKWEPPRLVEVQHTGRIVRGPGIFEIEPRGEHSTFVWTERLLPALRLPRRGRLAPGPAVRAVRHPPLAEALRRGSPPTPAEAARIAATSAR